MVAGLGSQEILLLVGLALLLFGPQKIPQLAQALGQAQAKYKEGVNEVKNSFTAAPSQNNGMDPALTPEELRLIKVAKSKGIPTEHRSIEAIAQDLLKVE